MPRYLLIPQQGTNALGLEAKAIGVSSYVPLELVRLNAPARVRWTMLGTNEEGFITPDQAAIATVYPAALAGSGKRCANFSLLTLAGFSGRVPFVVASDGHVVARSALAADQTLTMKEPLYPVPGSGGPHTSISVQMLPGPSYPNGTPVQARLAFFEVGPCADSTD